MTTPDLTGPVRYPDIEVRLIGTDGNAYAVISQVRKALREAGVEPTEIGDYVKEAMSGDYNNVLATTMAWVDVS
jgi:hypothetical protein